MSMLATINQRLGLKLFVSYLVIVIAGMIVLAGAVRLQTPAALTQHTAHMVDLAGNDPTLVAELKRSFEVAVNQIVTVATVAALLSAIAVSIFTARRIVGPIQDMMQASRRLAAGDYRQRVQVTGQDELGALAETFNLMATTLEQTEQRRLELIGNVAHELRTPLASIRSAMEGLIDGVLPPEQDTFADVQRQVSRLQRLVGDLQELSRAEAGQIALDVRPVSPGELIAMAAAHLSPQYQDKDVQLHIVVPDGLPPVRADAGRIAQVLVNLLGNALQYTPSGGMVTLRAGRSAHGIVFSVEDTGIGVAEEHLPHIFERFYRVDKSRSRAGGGSGLGLTIAKRLVEQHGGHITAASAGLGQGSTFTFTLPHAL